MIIYSALRIKWQLQGLLNLKVSSPSCLLLLLLMNFRRASRKVDNYDEGSGYGHTTHLQYESRLLRTENDCKWALRATRLWRYADGSCVLGIRA